MSPERSSSDIRPQRLRYGTRIRITIVVALYLSITMQPHAAETLDPAARATLNFRPQPAEEDLPTAMRRTTPASEKIADPEREFAMRMLESAERELRIAETHANIVKDGEIKRIANDIAASRRNEIAKLQTWLAQRKVLKTPRMLKQ